VSIESGKSASAYRRNIRYPKDDIPSQKFAEKDREKRSQIRALARQECVESDDEHKHRALALATGGHGVGHILRNASVTRNLVMRLVMGQDE
jgi:hypothetical protein